MSQMMAIQNIHPNHRITIRFHITDLSASGITKRKKGTGDDYSPVPILSGIYLVIFAFFPIPLFLRRDVYAFRFAFGTLITAFL